ncbi:MAG: hypothetical protein JWN13_5010 [Betaproteobacteria bacterium]|nr:hypothetical protein [Betaproteobacteria bacterium]
MLLQNEHEQRPARHLVSVARREERLIALIRLVRVDETFPVLSPCVVRTQRVAKELVRPAYFSASAFAYGSSSNLLALNR